jgi:integrase/recombinase XerC
VYVSDMAHELITTPATLAHYTPTASRLVEVFLSGKSGRTLRAYGLDLQDFATFVGAESTEKAAEALLARGHGAANELALGWRANLLERGLSPATVNRRLAALRSLVKLARTLGMVPWSLELAGVASAKYRETKGPGRAGFRTLLDLTEKDATPKGLRDRLVLRLLWDLALRREEVVSLDVANVDLVAGTVSILGKGRRERETLTLPTTTVAALRTWLAVRGATPGPLVVNVDRRTKGERLTGAGLYHLVQALGRRAGLTVRPHGVRHAAITEALEKTGGNVRAVQRFSRHRDLRTLTTYDDNRADLAGEVAALVAGAA